MFPCGGYTKRHALYNWLLGHTIHVEATARGSRVDVSTVVYARSGDLESAKKATAYYSPCS